MDAVLFDLIQALGVILFGSIGLYSLSGAIFIWRNRHAQNHENPPPKLYVRDGSWESAPNIPSQIEFWKCPVQVANFLIGILLGAMLVSGLTFLFFMW